MTTMKILDHQHVFYDGMKEIYKSRKYSDIILIAGGKQYHCHRIILCAFKPEWCNLRTVTPHPKIVVGHIGSKFLENWLSLAYLGETSVLLTDHADFIGQSFIYGDYDEVVEHNFVNIKLKCHYKNLAHYIFNDFSRLYNEPKKTDGQLIFTMDSYEPYDDKSVFQKIDIHRIIISMFSPEAEQMFGEPKNPIHIIVSDFRIGELFRRLIYTGNINRISDQDSKEVMQVLRSMSCKGDIQIVQDVPCQLFKK